MGTPLQACRPAGSAAADEPGAGEVREHRLGGALGPWAAMRLETRRWSRLDATRSARSVRVVRIGASAQVWKGIELTG
ncbi:hypothetical protein GCM10010170_084800 [Dactylosporangium salmoneum]|uniref:Uncharacterized protein n=1 Tax=Dactylosporangium salmoneum TaxID=53361 RepID=A0ABP5UHS5_9ACTN